MKTILLLFFTFIIGLSANFSQNISIKKITASPNPTGIQLGFWELNNKQIYSLENFGKRPTSRVDFTSWSSIETSQGVYDFSTTFNHFKYAHDFGETVLGAVNICFSSQVTPNKTTIPSFYYNRITDSTTRQAAKNFLYTYVQEALTEVGSLVLTIDYEICSNYKLSTAGSETRAAEWGAWYVEAAAVARQAALDLGMSDKLKLQPIVNGDPFATGNPIFNGPSTNQWLVDVVNASDYLALDTYQSSPLYSSTSAQTTFDIIQFWIDNYSGSKDVMVTENGFTTITQIDSTITRVDRDYKTTGTEADQAVFYQNLFSQLGAANQPGGIFHNKLRSYNLWSIRDNTAKPVGNEDRYFGLVGIDPAGNDYLKPAMPVVQNGYATLESDSLLCPSKFTHDTDATTSLSSGNANLLLNYNGGNDYDFIRYTDSSLAICPSYILHISTIYPGNVILHVNNKWLVNSADTTFDIDVTPYCTAGALNVIDIYFTSEKFPFIQHVKSVNLASCTTTGTGEIDQAEKISITPNPAQSFISISGINLQKDFNIEIYDAPGQKLYHVANTGTIVISKLPAGIYILKLWQGDEVYNQKFLKN